MPHPSRSASAVLLAGGGTAGHVNPLLAVADELRRRDPDVALAILGTTEGLEADLVPARGYTLTPLSRVPFPRRPGMDWFQFPGRFSDAVRAAGQAIDDSGAQAVVGFGGYVSTPAYVAARRRGVPVVIHEQNARPGLANRLGARWAARVGVTFEGTPLPGGVVTGLPLRAEVAGLVAAREADVDAVRRDAAKELGLDPALPTLLVTGGSLGAVSLNRAVSGAAPALAEAGIQVLHLTGRDKSAEVLSTLGQAPGPNYHVREYLDRMHLAYAVADLVVCRSGAGTVSELAALSIPAVYVPLPVGNGEQRLNARPVVEAGGGILVEDEDLHPAYVEKQLVPLLTDRDRLVTMAQSAGEVGVRDGAARVADLVAEVVS
ncbi:UDP-N-acetylglucosamine-N-acetylmuramylpentapeptide N-acetylglucosamine transferase [Paraoerskovia marina]|uniref:UDP-N-acetylglucosamine--N-acetylmuramyl-(pentapeptide) pyrophosphoryl-undecaprenol N-acetylglucosamine transferase n=1 Tax=Paraoerskovia marina TaxID=545619 RepID=A0A1H1TS74_9CELL|nr:undecaprenyldiphospho-muramoylpentapeptide beta-N-acetylglucosaminyltransferase [Paraoerskovia marina]SDS62439.1 UDP-N-acetylglucosamine-N-acetylmuramylpentapeptide N-acetylglucosamine transferase [Paraoerskovia marina]